MSVITKEIELTPQDVIEALRGFEEEEWAEVLAFLETEVPFLRRSPVSLDELEPIPRSHLGRRRGTRSPWRRWNGWRA
jgi:hypothetical protein